MHSSKSLKMLCIVEVFLVIGGILIGMFDGCAYANPYDPTTGRTFRRGYTIITVDSPQNTTYHTNSIPFDITVRTNWLISGNHRLFYILDGKNHETVNQARVDLLTPTKVTKTTLPQTTTYESETEATYQFHIILTNLTEGTHALIWGIASKASTTSTWNPYISELTPNLYFTVDCYPDVNIQSPHNTQTYQTSTVPLTFIVYEACTQYKYSLNGQENITANGNTTLTGLQNGDHTLAVYAGVQRYNPTLGYVPEVGYVGGYETQWLTNQAHFTINAPTSLTPTPTQTPTPKPASTEPTPSPQPTQTTATPTMEPTTTPTQTTQDTKAQNQTETYLLVTVAAIAIAAGVLVAVRLTKKRLV